MPEQTTRTILVIGATGAMGRPIVSRLLTDKNNNWRIRALTRNMGYHEIINYCENFTPI